MRMEDFENALQMIKNISIFIGANDKEVYQDVMDKNAWIRRNQHLGSAKDCLRALLESTVIEYEREIEKREDALFERQDDLYSCLCGIMNAYDMKCDAIRGGDKEEEERQQQYIDKLNDDFLRMIGW